MATIIIPAGETKPVRIPKGSQMDIIENPPGTKGYVALLCTNPQEKIFYPLRAHPYANNLNVMGEMCDLTNVAVQGPMPNVSVTVAIIEPPPPVTEV